MRQPSSQISVYFVHTPSSICSGDRQQVLGNTVEDRFSSLVIFLARLKPPSLIFLLCVSLKQMLEGLMFLCIMLALWMQSIAWASWQKILQTSSSSIFLFSALALLSRSCKVPPSQCSITMSTVTSFLLISQSRYLRICTQFICRRVLTSLTMYSFYLGVIDEKDTFLRMTALQSVLLTARKMFFVFLSTIVYLSSILTIFVQILTTIQLVSIEQFKQSFGLQRIVLSSTPKNSQDSNCRLFQMPQPYIELKKLNQSKCLGNCNKLFYFEACLVVKMCLRASKLKKAGVFACLRELPKKRQVTYQYFGNKYNLRCFFMSKLKSHSFTQATKSAESTINTIINQGANQLFENYVKTKIPANLKNSLEKVLENVFHPYTHNNYNVPKEIRNIHQSHSQKINIVQEKRKFVSRLAVQGQSLCFSNRNTIEVDRKVGRIVPSNELTQKKCHQRKRQIKKPSKCVPFAQNFGWLENNEEIEEKWAQRQKRFNQKLNQEQQQRQQKAKSARLQKCLELQLQELEENNKTIAFNHLTGRIFELQQHHQYDNSNSPIQKNLIHLKFGFAEKNGSFLEKSTEVKQSTVRNSRKITSFDRNRRKINFIDEDADEANYNNNGSRQISNLPFVQLQEGVAIVEGKSEDFSMKESKNTKSRINSASLTQRNFKSYTREKFESSRCIKTALTTTSAVKTRYISRGDREENKRIDSTKQSILWRQKGQTKNHKISKNPELMENYFSLTEES